MLLGLFCAAVVLLGSSCLVFALDYEHSAYLDAPVNSVLFKWSIGNSSTSSSAKPNDIIVAEIAAPGVGYIALGLSPNGGMPGANMLVMWVDDNGVAHVEDRYATDFIEPVVVPGSTAVLSFTGSKNATHTTMSFVRWVDAGCQNVHDLSITSSALYVIYAYNDNAPDADGHILYHGPSQRGSHTLYLVDDVSGDYERDEAAAIRDGTIIAEFRADNFEVPAVDTLYQCTFYQLPEITDDVHVVGFVPIIQTNNTDLIHHFNVHMCDYGAFTPDASPPNVTQFACYDTPPEQLDPNTTAHCLGHTFWAWAVGSTGAYMPHDVGYKLTAQDSKRFFVFEIHYNNPGLVANRRDNSGFRLLMTKNVRPNEASILSVAVPADYSIVIPGNVPVFTVPAFCPSECTDEYLPATGTRAFSVFLHSHLLGYSMALRQFRRQDNTTDVYKELPPLLADSTYDFNYQQYRPVNVSILPGDRLILECNYSTTARTQRSNTTLGGLSTREEMCVAAIFVTPAVDLQACISTINRTVLTEITNTTDIIPPPKNSTWEQDKAYEDAMAARLHGITWNTSSTDALAITLQTFYLRSPQTYICLRNNEKIRYATGTTPAWIPFQAPDHCIAN